jgi:hypothetical protein
MNKIISIQRGSGTIGSYYTIIPQNKANEFCYVDEIKEEQKQYIIRESGGDDILVYRGYRNGILIFEMEANSGLTIRY